MRTRPAARHAHRPDPAAPLTERSARSGAPASTQHAVALIALLAIAAPSLGSWADAARGWEDAGSQPAPAGGNEPVIDVPGLARTPRPGQVLPTPPTPTPPTPPTPAPTTTPAPPTTPPAPPDTSPTARPGATATSRGAGTEGSPAIGISQGPIFLPPPRIEPPPAGAAPGSTPDGTFGLVRSLEGSLLISDVRPLSPALASRTVRGRLEPTILRVDSLRGGGVQLRRVAGDRAEPWQLAQEGQELSGDFELRSGPTTDAVLSVGPSARVRVGPLTRARVLRLNDPGAGGPVALVLVHRGVVERVGGEALLATPSAVFDPAQARTVIHDPAGGTRVGGAR